MALSLQENILLDAMFDVPGSNITAVMITEKVVKGEEPAAYIRSPKLTKDEHEAAEDSCCEDEEEVKVRQS